MKSTLPVATEADRKAMELFRKFSVSGRVKAERDELLGKLKELVAIAGEANIPMVNSHAVRKMGKFLDVMGKAKALIAEIEGRP